MVSLQAASRSFVRSSLVNSAVRRRPGTGPDGRDRQPPLWRVVPLAARQEIVDWFQSDGDALILSVRAAGTGFNLTRAGHVIHFDRRVLACSFGVDLDPVGTDSHLGHVEAFSFLSVDDRGFGRCRPDRSRHADRRNGPRSVRSVTRRPVASATRTGAGSSCGTT